MEETLNEWFIQNILVHERALMRFLSHVWPNVSEIDDLRHEAYVKVLESAAVSLPVSPRAFLFTTVRHLMVDRLRRGRIVSIEFQADLDALNVVIDEFSPERLIGGREDLWALAQAFEKLPEKCRDIMWLVKVEELPQKQIADRMNLTVRAVEKRIALGLRLLRENYLRHSRSRDARFGVARVKGGEPGHG